MDGVWINIFIHSQDCAVKYANTPRDAKRENYPESYYLVEEIRKLGK